MLGAALVYKLQDSYDVYASDKASFKNNPAKKFMAFDLLAQSYDALMDWAEVEIIIHCAAITNVNHCEEYPEQAMAVNGESVNKFLQQVADSKLIFISSDAIFPDGVHMATEKDEKNPENVYGKSKELGEKYIKNTGGSHAAIRTTIVGKNINPAYQGFVEWIIKSVKDGKEITLFDDALFTPITICHLADELEWIMGNDITGIIHISGIEPVSKYDFGKKVCEGLDLDTSLIHQGSIDDVNFQAKRSKDQTMDSCYYRRLSDRDLPSTAETVELIVQHFKKFDYA